MAAAAVAMVLMLGGCVEPAMQLAADGTTPGRARVGGPCSPMNCTGCCAGDVCLGGNMDEACGYDGRACEVCPSTHRCETPGACYPQPMPASMKPPEPIPDDAHCYLVDGMMRCL